MNLIFCMFFSVTLPLNFWSASVEVDRMEGEETWGKQ